MKLKIDTFVKSAFMLFLFTALGTSAFAQRTITGTVTDGGEEGEPLIGATVLAVGTTSGTVTDFDGNYSLSITDDVTELEFSYTGYATQRATIGASNVLDVELSAGTVLDEVVVVGYGTVKKSDLTGSVASVKEEDFNQGVYTAPDQLIQGKVAGVQVLGNSGQPGAAATVRIRGNSSIRAGSQPLYVVDGIPLDGRNARPGVSNDDIDAGASPNTNPLNFLNPNDIASMEVLKDASATAIYGSRGANGVVIITTKRGRSGDPKIDFGVSMGASTILNRYEVLNADEYTDALAEFGQMSGDFGGDEDALSAILRTGLTQNYNISIGGGSENGTYRVSASILDQEGIIKETGIKKYTGSINGSYKFLDSKRLKVDFQLLGSQQVEDIEALGTNAGFTGNLIGQALQWNPTRPLILDNGELDIELGSTTINPLGLLEAYDDRANITTILGSIAPSYKITDDLEYKFLYSVNHNVGDRRTQTKGFINVQNVEGRGVGIIGQESLTTQQFTHTLSYNKQLSSALGFGGVIGYEYQKFDRRGFTILARDFVTDDIDFTNAIQNSSSNSREARSFADPISEIQSFFGQFRFNLNEKYLLTATVRTDGSSKFGNNFRYGVFPSFAAAWNISSEDFMASSPFDQLKLRVGWGRTGNQEFDAGSAQERYQLTDNGGLRLENVANDSLRWESSTTLNLGIDFAIFDYRLSGSIEFFNKVDDDLLFNFRDIATAPETRYWINLPGQVLNQGVEIALNSFLIRKEKLSLQLGVNATFLRNELQNYNGPPVLTGELFGQGVSNATTQRLEEGQPLNAFYLRDWMGLDDNGNNIFRESDQSFFFVGNPNPTTLLGVTVDLQYDKLSFGMNFNGALGHDIYNNTKNSVLAIGNIGTRNISADLVGSGESPANIAQPSSRYLEDGSYVKLANAQIGYNFGSLGNSISNVRVSITGQNLLVFINFTGFDPEVNTINDREGFPSVGIEYVPYPSARQFLFGLNFSF